MKKFTSMLMSALVLLQVGGNVAGAKTDSTYIQVPETKKQKFVVIQKEQKKGAGLGLKIASIAGASILAGLGVFGIYKYVTNRKEDAKKNEEEENENENEDENKNKTPLDQKLKSKGTDLEGLSNEELAQLNSETDQELSKDAGAGAGGDADPKSATKAKKLQDSKKAIEGEMVKRGMDPSQSSSANTNLTLAVVNTGKRRTELDLSQFPKEFSKADGQANSDDSNTTGTNRTQAVVGNPLVGKAPIVKQADKDKTKALPGLIELKRTAKASSSKRIKSITIYGTPGTVTISGLPSGFKVNYVDPIKKPPEYSDERFKVDVGCGKWKVYLLYPFNGSATVVGVIEFTPVSVQDNDDLLMSPEMGQNMWYLQNDLNFSNSQGSCNATWVANSSSNFRPIDLSAGGPFHSLKDYKLKDDYIHWRAGSLMLTHNYEFIPDSNDPDVKRRIQRVYDYLQSPSDQSQQKDKDNPLELTPIAIGDINSAKEVLAMYGLEIVSEQNYLGDSPLPEQIKVRKQYLGKDKAGKAKPIHVNYSSNFGWTSPIPFSTEITERTTVGEFLQKIKFNPGAKGGYQDTFVVVSDPKHMEQRQQYDLMVQSTQGGLVPLKENSSTLMLESIYGLSRKNQAKLVGEVPNTITLDHLAYVKGTDKYCFNRSLADIAAFLVNDNGTEKVIYLNTSPSLGQTLGSFFDTHNRTGAPGSWLIKDDKTLFRNWEEVVGPSRNLSKKPIQVIGMVPKSKPKDEPKQQDKENKEEVTVSLSTEAESKTNP